MNIEQVVTEHEKYSKECYHQFVCMSMATELGLLQFMYENTGHAYAVDADNKCAYLTSPVADED